MEIIGIKDAATKIPILKDMAKDVAEATKIPTLKDMAKDVAEATKSDSSIFTGALKGENSSSIVGKPTRNLFVDSCYIKPETDEETLKALKEQQAKESLYKIDGNTEKHNEKMNRRAKVISLMHQGYTYDEALQKTKPSNPLIMTIAPINKNDNADPFFIDDTINSPFDFDLKSY